jgi:hypothetical protein
LINLPLTQKRDRLSTTSENTSNVGLILGAGVTDVPANQSLRPDALIAQIGRILNEALSMQSKLSLWSCWAVVYSLESSHAALLKGDSEGPPKLVALLLCLSLAYSVLGFTL